jgi:glycosyltransferase involved in cell wall biosynthesis
VPVVCDEWPVYGPVVDAWLRPLVPRRRLARVVSAVTGLATTLPPLDSAASACFVSAFLGDVVRRRSPWTFPRAAVVYSGIDLDEFPLAPEVERPWAWRLLYVGRIDPRKGIDTVIRALGRCPPQATLDVHGQGDDRYLAELQKSCADLGLEGRVRFTVTPRSKLSAVYRQADALVFPSVWEEPFGLVPIEAMASATPVVATLVGGAGEFLEDGRNCLAFAPGDDEALTAALTSLAGDASLRARLVAGGRQTAAQFTVDRLAEVLEEHHQRAMTGA